MDHLYADNFKIKPRFFSSSKRTIKDDRDERVDRDIRVERDDRYANMIKMTEMI